MTREHYEMITGPFRDNPRRIRLLHRMNRICTLTVVAAYRGLLVIGVWQRASWLAGSILVPLCSFLMVSAFRRILNRRRPYEEFGLPPLIPKETGGKSFPSRHVFSSFVIAVTFFWNTPWHAVGGLLIAVSIMIAAIRVLSGVHYISDVAAGALCGIAAGFFGYLVL